MKKEETNIVSTRRASKGDIRENVVRVWCTTLFGRCTLTKPYQQPQSGRLSRIFILENASVWFRHWPIDEVKMGWRTWLLLAL